MSSSDTPTTSDATGPWTDETRRKFETKSKSKYLDPCQEAAAKSINCLKRNNGDRSMCGDYFQAYRECRQSWMDKRKEERRQAGGGLW